MIGEIWLTQQMVPNLSTRLGVHRSTIYRWLREGQLPPAMYALLDITENGRLGRIHNDWSAWRIDIRTGELVTPIVRRARNRRIKPGEIMSEQLRYQQISALKAGNQALRDRCKQLENRIEILEKYLADYERGTLVALPNRNKL